VANLKDTRGSPEAGAYRQAPPAQHRTPGPKVHPALPPDGWAGYLGTLGHKRNNWHLARALEVTITQRLSFLSIRRRLRKAEEASIARNRLMQGATGNICKRGMAFQPDKRPPLGSNFISVNSPSIVLPASSLRGNIHEVPPGKRTREISSRDSGVQCKEPVKYKLAVMYSCYQR